MNEKEIAKMIAESEVLEPYLRKMPPIPQYQLDSQQAIELYRKDVDAMEENNFRIAVFQCAYDIAIWLSEGGGSFTSLQCMTPESHKKTFSQINFGQLETNAQGIRQEIKRLKMAKPLILKLIDANAKAQWDKTQYNHC